jgi:2-oxoisovalerate dehydrogenase E1 component beta subunit
MDRDPHVFLMGEDIGGYGGAFKLTAGLLQQYGPDRVMDTPITETGMIGTAAGAALMGLRPVVEMQFIDFISCGFNQLTNVAAKFHYRTGRPLPLVVRGPCGGGVGAGPFHSQNPEAYFFHTPGLKILAPATPGDARGLLKAAIRDDDPVLFLEYKSLYRQIKEAVLLTDETVPVGTALIRKPGSDLSIITYGAMVHKSLEAANKLQDDEGIDIEVLDLRTLMPLDEEQILNSVKKTNRALIVHEATRAGGLAAEIIARISETVFDYLDAPLTRVTAEDTMVPYSLPLEEAFLPQVGNIISAARWLARY